MTQAWASQCPETSFSGVTLTEFTAGCKPSADARAELADLVSRTVSTKAKITVCDAASLALIKRIVHGVKGDPNHGEDGPLYAAMGFVRASERSSGLTRKRANGTQPAPKKVEVPKVEVPSS
jgi:hypothetical protein